MENYWFALNVNRRHPNSPDGFAFAVDKSDLPLNDYKLKTFYMPKKDEKALSELKNAIDSLNCSDEDKLQLMKVMTGQL